MFVQKICEVRNLDPWFKEYLDDELAKEKDNILNYMKEVRKENV